NPVSISTAGVSPALTVRSRCASNAGQSTLPDSVNGNNIAETPRTDRRGRNIDTGSIASGVWDIVKGAYRWMGFVTNCHQVSRTFFNAKAQRCEDAKAGQMSLPDTPPNL